MDVNSDMWIIIYKYKHIDIYVYDILLGKWIFCEWLRRHSLISFPVVGLKES